MPFIIWGSRGLTSTLGEGEFFCPQCNADKVPYAHRAVRSWLTLYFIPIFPISGATSYIECRSCKGAFKEEVLELRPMTEAEKIANEIFEDLHRGSSVQDVRGYLDASGVDEHIAHGFLEKIIEGQGLWTCAECGNQYLSSVKQCRACASAAHSK
jgi:predicted RNA-binding Zn-ribbon protein involved in translation (DUF1610 family)